MAVTFRKLPHHLQNAGPASEVQILPSQSSCLVRSSGLWVKKFVTAPHTRTCQISFLQAIFISTLNPSLTTLWEGHFGYVPKACGKPHAFSYTLVITSLGTIFTLLPYLGGRFWLRTSVVTSHIPLYNLITSLKQSTVLA